MKDWPKDSVWLLCVSVQCSLNINVSRRPVTHQADELPVEPTHDVWALLWLGPEDSQAGHEDRSSFLVEWRFNVLNLRLCVCPAFVWWEEKKKKALEVEVNMGVAWMTYTGIDRRCQNQQECKYPSLRGQYWPTLTSQVCFLSNILRVHYNNIQVWDRNNFRHQFRSLTSWRRWWPEFSSVCWSADTG